MNKRYWRAALALVAAACDPYSAQQGEFTAGPVDPANFPAPYLGVGADTGPNGLRSGRGRFFEVPAFIDGNAAGYYSFPFTTAQLAPTADPLRLLDNGNAYAPVPVPVAYVFDPAPPSPFPAQPTCTPPPSYVYNPRVEDMRLDDQSNVFTQLPLATERPGVASDFTYVPIVAEVPVSAAGRSCQSIKSEGTLNRLLGNPAPSGQYLLWAIIDPASGVYRVGQSTTFGDPNYATGVGAQRYGWYGHYYLAYLDGGYIPTESANVAGRQVIRMKTQRLFIPRTVTPTVACGNPARNCAPGQVCVASSCRNCTATGSNACPTGQTCLNASSGTPTCSGPGAVRAGYDVLQARRAADAYSPVCEQWQYTAPNVGSPPRPPAASELPRSEAEIRNLPAPNLQQVTSGNDRLFYCPQVD